MEFPNWNYLMSNQIDLYLEGHIEAYIELNQALKNKVFRYHYSYTKIYMYYCKYPFVMQKKKLVEIQRGLVSLIVLKEGPSS